MLVVSGLAIDAIYDEHFNRRLRSFQVQPELLLHRRSQSRLIVYARSAILTPVAVKVPPDERELDCVLGRLCKSEAGWSLGPPLAGTRL